MIMKNSASNPTPHTIRSTSGPDPNIAHGTLRVHVQHLYEKLDVHPKQEAVGFVNEWRG